MTLIKQYLQKEQEYINRYGEKTIFLMQCGSFYEVYCCKLNHKFTSTRIEEFSRICDMRIANKKSTHNGLRVYMSGFPELHLEKYVKKLNDAGYTVPVWCQDTTNPKIRKELGVFSPGTNFSVSNSLANRIMTVWIEKHDKTLLNKQARISVGIATVDIITGEVFTFQNIEHYFHNPTTFDELERFYCSYHPNELIIIHNCEDKIISDIISFADINNDTIHLLHMDNTKSNWHVEIQNCQKQIYQEAEYKKYYAINDYDIFYDSHKLREREIASRSLIFLLNFLDYHNKGLVKQIKEPQYINIDVRLRLANHSLRQLNIISTGKRGRISSLEDLLNKCKTPMGKRHLRHKLLNPTTNTQFLQSEYDIQSHIHSTNENWETTWKMLNNITDFERLYRKIILNKITPSDLIMLYDNLTVIMKIHKELISDKILMTYLNIPVLSKSIRTLRSKIKSVIKRNVAINISATTFDENIFKRGCGENFSRLDTIEYEYMDCKNAIEALRLYYDSLIIEKKSRTKERVKIHQTDKSGLFLISTKTRCKKLPVINSSVESQKNIRISYNCFDDNREILLADTAIKTCNASGNNLRIDSEILTPLYHKLMQNKSNLKEILMSVYRNFIQSFTVNKTDFDKIIEYVTKLDFLFTRCHIAKKYNYCKPELQQHTQSFVNAKELRHPLIEHIQTNEIYVPNNITLGKNTTTGILLYGTNAVGKSSLIKALGMNVILAQSGFYVSCSKFVYCPYTAIFTRILSNDDLFNNLSTYSVEISELRTIWLNANKHSLVLGDELCSGTENRSALCVIAAGLNKLHNENASFIFATHFHELIDKDFYISKLDKLALMHMTVEFDKKTGNLIYNRKLQSGSGNRLYGLEVCKALSMPPDFMDMVNRFRTLQEYANSDANELILRKKQAVYNKNKLKGNCELCGKNAVDIHHMYPQKDANKDGFIKGFHKNHKANLMNICKKCHIKVTRNDTKHIVKKTSTGLLLQEVTA